jgi:hypothetical protein
MTLEGAADASIAIRFVSTWTTFERHPATALALDGLI